MAEFRAGVIGSGGFALDMGPSAKECRVLRFAGAYDTNPEAVDKFVSEFGGRAYTTLEELLADDSIDGVVIVTPNDTHRELAEKSAAAGKHVFVEKPIANNVEDARAIMRATAEAGVTLFVGHLARRHSAMRLAKRMIEAGEFGRVVLIEGHTAHAGGLELTSQMWRWYSRRCPGGPLMQLAVHTADTFNYLMGPAKSVSAKTARLATPGEIDDVGVVCIEYANGALGCIGTAYTVPSSSFTHIYGTEAAVEHNRHFGEFVVRTRDGRTEARTPAQEVNPVTEELDEFARCSQTGSRPETGGREGLEALAVILAALRSAAEGRSVTIAEILGE